MKLVPAGSTGRQAKLYTLAGLLVVGLLLAVSAPQAGADDYNRAGLVIDYGGNVATFCVSFYEDSITGMDVLERAGRQLVGGFGGGAVCAIDRVGCPANDCWCECRNPSSGCTYWIYWHLIGGKWVYSSRGAAGYQVHNGDVEGWIWGSGSSSGGAQPPVYTMEQLEPLCQPPSAPTAAPSDTPTATDTPTSTHTPVPSNTPTATSTPVPTDTRAPTNTPDISFRADATELVAGSCTTLRWDVEDVQEVYLDGQPQQGHGSKQACPAQTQTYELRVVSAAGEFRHQVTVNVVQPSPTIIPPDTHTPLPAAASAPTDIPELLPEVPSPTPASLPTETLPLTVTLLPTDTATPTPSPPAVVMVAPPTAPAKKETDALSKADQPAEISPTKVTILNWLLFLAAAVVGTLGFGGMAFVGILAVLGVIYLFARWSQDGEGDYGEEGNVDGYH